MLAVVFGGLLAMAVWFGVAVTSPFVETFGTFSVDWYLIDVREDDSVLVLGAQRIDVEGRHRDILCDDVALDVQAVDFADVNVVINITGRHVNVDPEQSRRTAGCNRRETLGRVEVVLPRPLDGRPLVGCSHSECSRFVVGRTLSDELLARVDAIPRTPSN